MDKSIATPYLTLSDKAVSPGPWKVLTSDGKSWKKVGAQIEEWDHASKLKLSRSFKPRPKVIEKELSLIGPKLSVVIRVGTGPSSVLPRAITEEFVFDFQGSDQGLEIEISPSSRLLSAAIHLQTNIVLASPGVVKSRFSPSIDGARVWEETDRISLEPEKPRFPIEIVDFSLLPLPDHSQDSPWWLSWSTTNWSRDFSSSVRLFLNKNHQDFIERFIQRDPVVLQGVMSGIMYQICVRYLLDGDISDSSYEKEQGTLAYQAARWIDVIWPGRNSSFVKSVHESSPGIFFASFLALAEMGDDF